MSLFDLTVIMNMADGNEDFVYEFIETFLKRTPVTLNELNKAWENKELENTHLMAHKLKSTIDLTRIDILKDEIRYIEKNAQDIEKEEELNDKIQKVTQVLEQVFKEMQEEI